MSAKLEGLLTCNELVTKHAHQLQRQLTDLDETTLNASPEMKLSHEKAMLFKISSSAMLGVRCLSLLLVPYLSPPFPFSLSFSLPQTQFSL